jgi:hypothetical protein
LSNSFAEQISHKSVRTGAGYLFITAHHSSLAKGKILKYFEPAFPSSYLVGEANVFRTKGLVKQLETGVYFDGTKIFGLGKAARYGEQSFIVDLNPVLSEKYAVREFVEDSAGKWLARNIGIPFILDFGFQLADDWRNPRLTTGQKVGRAFVSGSVGVVGGGIAYGLCWLAVGATPPGWLLLAGGIIIGIGFENPVSQYINDRVFPEKP